MSCTYLRISEMYQQIVTSKNKEHTKEKEHFYLRKSSSVAMRDVAKVLVSYVSELYQVMWSIFQLKFNGAKLVQRALTNYLIYMTRKLTDEFLLRDFSYKRLLSLEICNGQCTLLFYGFHTIMKVILSLRILLCVFFTWS